jgi:maleylpyruvate isomerase
MQLHGYFRSSASYRVRIAIDLKGPTAKQFSCHLRNGEQRSSAYLAMNLQGLVATFSDARRHLPCSANGQRKAFWRGP